MNANGIEPGDYIITNLRTKAVLDAQDGKTIGCPYTTSASQTWTLETDGNFWTIQNALSKRYLGMRLTDKMKNGAGIQEVDHAFSWSLEQAADHIKIAVPYSNYFLDIYGKNEVGTAAYLYESDENNTYRRWVFSKPTVLPIQDGEIYLLVNNMSGTAVGFTNDKLACGLQRKPECSSQHFRAIRAAHGWAFQHVDSNLYLGLPPTIVVIAHGTRVRGVSDPFPWMVLPASTLDNKPIFKVFVPYTERLLDLDGGQKDDGRKVAIYGNNDKAFKQWKFESVPVQPQGGVIVGERLHDLEHVS